MKTKAQKKWIAGHSLGVGVDAQKEGRSVRRSRGTDLFYCAQLKKIIREKTDRYCDGMHPGIESNFDARDRQEKCQQGEAKRRSAGVEGGRGGLYSVDTVSASGRGGFRPVPPAMPFERSKSAGTTHVIHSGAQHSHPNSIQYHLIRLMYLVILLTAANAPGGQWGRSNAPGSKASSESLHSDSDSLSKDNGHIFSSLHHRNQAPLGKPPDVVAFELAMKECSRWLENECR